MSIGCMLKLIKYVTRNMFLNSFPREVAIVSELLQKGQSTDYIRTQILCFVPVQK